MMSIRISLLALASQFYFFLNSYGAAAKMTNGAGFEENKGQVHDQNGKSRPDVKFMARTGDLTLILRENGFSYQLIKSMSQPSEGKNANGRSHAKEKTTSVSNRIDVTLEGSNPHPVLRTGRRLPDYSNYITEDGAFTAFGYDEVTYQDIYTGIDLHFYLKEGKLKYDFIVHPNANPQSIKLLYKGQKKLNVNNNKLLIETESGALEEDIPMSYLESNGTKKEVSVSYQLKQDQLTFLVPAYSSSETLTIDPSPSRKWGTFFGWDSNTEIYAVKTDSQNRPVIVGFTGSYSNLASSGAYQTVIDNGVDCFIAKFDTAGHRMWSTYYGGNSFDYGYGLSMDGNGNIFICGSTVSTDVIASPGAYQNAYGGGPYDGFVAKFDSNGFRIWSTYFGGAGDDEAEDIVVDSLGNVYVTGNTSSSSGISSGNVYQTTFGGGTNDGYVAHFSSNGGLIWSTYYGGSDVDDSHGIAYDKHNHIAIIGETRSATGIASTGAHQTSLGNVGDAFLSLLDTTGNQIWGTYYGGIISYWPSGRDVGHGVTFDSQQNVIGTGNAQSMNNIATPGAFLTVPNSTATGFLVKFNLAGVRQWGTYFGGEGYDIGYKTAVDASDNILMAGRTFSTTIPISTPGAFQENYAGNADGFIVKFTPSGSRVWSTYFGNAQMEEGYAFTTGAHNTYYFAGSTQVYTSTYDSTYIGTPGAYQQHSDPAMITEGFLELFDELSISTGPVSSPMCGGNSFSVNFTATGDFSPTKTFQAILSNASGSFSNYTVIGTSTGVLSGSINCVIPLHQPGGTGYRVAVRSVDRHVYDQNNGSNITIYYVPVVSDTLMAGICVGAHYIPLSGVHPGGQPTGGTFSGSGVDSLGNFYPNVAGVGIANICYTYTDAHHCATQTTCTQVNVYPPPHATLTSLPPTICNNGPIVHLNGSPAPGMYSGPGLYAGSYFSPGQAGPGSSTITYVYVDPGGCPADTVRQTTNVLQAASSHFYVAPDTVCVGVQAALHNTSLNATSSSWNFGDATNSTLMNPNHAWSVSGLYNVKLYVNNANNCPDSITHTVKVNPNASGVFLPAFDTLCVNSGLTFTNVSTHSSSYMWNFGDSGSSIQYAPTHSWAAPGDYTVQLIAYGTQGCLNDTVDHFVHVQSPHALPVNVSGNMMVASPGVSYQWYYSGYPISGGTSQQWNAANNGHYFVVVTDRFGCHDTSNVITMALGIKESSGSDNRISVYPNPSTGSFHLVLEMPERCRAGLEIENVLGQIIYSERFDVDSGHVEKELEISQPPGVYILRVKTPDSGFEKRILIL